MHSPPVVCVCVWGRVGACGGQEDREEKEVRRQGDTKQTKQTIFGLISTVWHKTVTELIQMLKYICRILINMWKKYSPVCSFFLLFSQSLLIFFGRFQITTAWHHMNQTQVWLVMVCIWQWFDTEWVRAVPWWLTLAQVQEAWVTVPRSGTATKWRQRGVTLSSLDSSSIF